jgi:8-oxo-dGTP pyrophosphatase MutT (NUDIX family)
LRRSSVDTNGETIEEAAAREALEELGVRILVSMCSVIGPLISYWSIGKSTSLRCFSFFVWNLGNSTRKFEKCIAVRVFFRHAGGLWLSSRKVVN